MLHLKRILKKIYKLQIALFNKKRYNFYIIINNLSRISNLYLKKFPVHGLMPVA